MSCSALCITIHWGWRLRGGWGGGRRNNLLFILRCTNTVTFLKLCLPFRSDTITLSQDFTVNGNLILLSRFPGSLQVLTSTYKLNLPSKALQVLIFASVLRSLANTKSAPG